MSLDIAQVFEVSCGFCWRSELSRSARTRKEAEEYLKELGWKSIETCDTIGTCCPECLAQLNDDEYTVIE